MSIELMRAELADAAVIHRLQVKAFAPLLERYQDVDTNPANEVVGDIIRRLQQPFTTYYFIALDKTRIGAIRVACREKDRARISPIFVIPEYQGKGYGQQAMALVECTIDAQTLELSTIQEESANCYMYEKMGYRKTGDPRVVNDRMTIISYEKSLKSPPSVA